MESVIISPARHAKTAIHQQGYRRMVVVLSAKKKKGRDSGQIIQKNVVSIAGSIVPEIQNTLKPKAK